MFKKKQTFSIRKYKVYGACSVLLGIAILSLTTPIKAEEAVASPQQETTEVESSVSVAEVFGDTISEVSADTLQSTSESTSSDNSIEAAASPILSVTPKRSSAMPRPTNEGRPLTAGTGFRAAPTDPTVTVTDTASLNIAIANNQNIIIINDFDITETIEATGYTGIITSDTEKTLTLANTVENMFAFSNSTVTFDKISLNAANKGRHIFSNSSTITLKNGSLINGTTENFGEKLELVTGIHLDKQLYTGGSIYSANSTITAENVNFENNKTKSVLTHATSEIPHGGAIYATNGTTVNIVGGSFKNNYTGRTLGNSYVGGEGGAIKVDGNSTLNINSEGSNSRTIFEGNHTNSTNSAGIGGNQGGSIEVTIARAYIYNADFKVATPVDSGGAIKFEDSQEAVVKDSTFVLDGIRNNLTTGGAITTQGSKTTIERSTFKLTNSRVSETGGLIHVGGTGEFNLKDSTLEGNGAWWNSVWQNGAAQKGGAIVFYDGSTVKALIENSTIKNFMVDVNGAAISVGKDFEGRSAVDLTIRNSTLENNAAYTWDNGPYGGQIFIGEGNTVLIDGGRIQGNTTSNTAAGIYNNGNLTVTGGAQIISNRAYQMVGGIYNNGYLKIDDATINNTYGDWSSSTGNHILNAAEHAGVNIYADKDVIITPNAKIIGGDIRVHDGASSIILTGTLTNAINVSISEQPKTSTNTHHNVVAFTEEDQRYVGYTVAKGDGTYTPVASDADKLHYVSKPGTGIYAQPVSELADNTSLGKWDFVFNHENNTVVVGQRAKVIYDANGGNFANIGTTNATEASALISSRTDATTSTSLQRVYKTETLTVPSSETPIRDGYKFVGWFTETDKDRVKELSTRQNLPVEFSGAFAVNNPQTDIIDPNELRAYAGWIKTYNVLHTFKKADGVNLELPQEVIGRITADKNRMDVENETIVNPNMTIDTSDYLDVVNNGTWKFIGWDKNVDTINNANVEFSGTWNFIPTQQRGSVIVHYKGVEVDGTQIDLKVDYMDSDNLVAGTNYNATENDEKPLKLEKNNKTYHYIQTTGATETGVVEAETTKEITYVYAVEQTEDTVTQAKGNVVIKYQDTQGNELQSDYTDTTDGVVSTTTVTKYFYVQADGTKQYLDAKEKTVTVPSSLTYDATQGNEKPLKLEKNNKTYHYIQTTGATETGVVEAGTTKEITYVYAVEQTEDIVTQAKGNVVIKYQDTQGNELQSDYTDTTDGLVSTTTVTKYFYVKDGAKQYLADKETTNTVPSNLTYDATEGTEKPLKLEKNNKTYHYIQTTGATETGVVEAGTTKEITYVYAVEQTEDIVTQAKGNVVIKYQDTQGNELQSDYTDTTDGVVSTTTVTKYFYVKADGTKQYLDDKETSSTVPSNLTYDATQGTEKPLTLEKDGQTYHYIKTDGATETGVIEAGVTKEITYVYAVEQSEELITENKGSVIIKYQDTEGNELQADYEDTKDGVVSTTTVTKYFYVKADGTKQYLDDKETSSTVPSNLTYDATQGTEKPLTLEKDGQTYHYIKTEGDETGAVEVGGPKVVTYVYAVEQSERKVRFESEKKSNKGEVNILPKTGDVSSIKNIVLGILLLLASFRMISVRKKED